MPSPTLACAERVCIRAVASIDHVPFSIFDYNADRQFPLTKQDGLHSNQLAEHSPGVKSADNEKNEVFSPPIGPLKKSPDCPKDFDACARVRAPESTW